MVIKIYTDGACSNNPGPGGYAALICMNNETIKVSGFEENTTNNRMELTAVVNALSRILDMIFQDDIKVEKLEIISDSAYVVNAVNQKWITLWETNNFVNSKCERVKNEDLWKQLIVIIKTIEFVNMELVFTKVKGHSGDYFNEMVDKMAKEQITNNLKNM